jgi:hypothetical protein
MKMTTGTKSLLFGVHQFLIHPFVVWLAWISLYKRLPTWKETVCIIIHDWGYWGKAKMDDAEGEKHPEVGAKIALYLFKDSKWSFFCLYHSRHYARHFKVEPSRLCWADKYSITFEPWWLYLPRAWLSGELEEYRHSAANAGFIPLTASHRRWYQWAQEWLGKQGLKQRGDVVLYVNPVRQAEEG